MQMKQLIVILSFALASGVYGQTYPALEKVLSKELSTKSQKDGRWVFYADKARTFKAFYLYVLYLKWFAIPEMSI